MKKILLILLLLIYCRKEETFCYDCTTEIRAGLSGSPPETEEVCGLTESQASSLSKTRTKVIKGIRITERTTCIKK